MAARIGILKDASHSVSLFWMSAGASADAMGGMEMNKDRMAMRVLLIISQSSPAWSRSWSSTQDVLPTALDALRKSQFLGLRQSDSTKEVEIPLRLLAKQKWPLRVLVVLDLFNESYNPKLGHLPEHNDLPVCVVFFGGKGVSARAADAGMRARVNRDIGHAHNLNGEGSVPPYVVDHTTTVPLYLNPRDPSLL